MHELDKEYSAVSIVILKEENLSDRSEGKALPGNEKVEKTDSELVTAVLAGHADLFGEILNRYRTKIMSICLKMLHDRLEAEEAAQEAFVKIYQHLEDFDLARSFIAWAGVIAMNECRDRQRRSIRQRRLFTDLEKADFRIENSPQENSLNSAQDLQRVEMAIDKLPPDLKEIIILKAYGEYSYDDIAKMLNVRLGTVMSRLFRAREKLTELLGGSGYAH